MGRWNARHKSTDYIQNEVCIDLPLIFHDELDLNAHFPALFQNGPEFAGDD